MFDDDASPMHLSAGEILSRLAEVSGMRHYEQGNREELQLEPAQFVELARKAGLFVAMYQSLQMLRKYILGERHFS